MEYEVGEKVFLKTSPWKGVMRFGKQDWRYLWNCRDSRCLPCVYVEETSEVQLRDDMSYEEQPVKILDTKEKVLRNKMVQLVKVLWRNHLVEEATWEPLDAMQEKYPHLFDDLGLKCGNAENWVSESSFRLARRDVRMNTPRRARGGSNVATNKYLFAATCDSLFATTYERSVHRDVRGRLIATYEEIWLAAASVPSSWRTFKCPIEETKPTSLHRKRKDTSESTTQAILGLMAFYENEKNEMMKALKNASNMEQIVMCIIWLTPLLSPPQVQIETIVDLARHRKLQAS
ncbi:hypothetical protein K2173_011087 [Erythroxylum novogranatense]|uniref:Chromo domain-containing protein n=1 Tax=Erythroxylum novogranatense TaxID=1862640 RepID=A0AAV8T0M5_9ROSI|nr:hypothetical protein K2173_011087 [Erythroxylum novogranatense]